MPQTQRELFQLPGDARQLFLTCRRCRRALRSDSSRRAGYGPHCLRLTQNMETKRTEAPTDDRDETDDGSGTAGSV